jgi:RNA polymerase sigma-70 factor (ECF subfamily)
MSMEMSVVAHPERDSASPTPLGFERFFRSNYPVVVRIAHSVVDDSDLAQDVAQDAFIAAQRRFPQPEGSDHAAAWVRTAAAHLALNAVRGRRRRENHQQRGTVDVSPPGPEELVLDRESGRAVSTALSRLPRHAATVLLLRHSGLSYAEVAQAMEVKVAQVGTMLRRAEAALREEVEHGTRS